MNVRLLPVCTHRHLPQDVDESNKKSEVLADDKVKGQQTDEHENTSIYCKLCEETLSTRRELNRHIKENHKTYKPCNKFKVDKCEFDNDCIFNYNSMNTCVLSVVIHLILNQT